MNRCAVCIGGFTISLDSDEPFELVPAMSRFAIPLDGPPDVALHVTRGFPVKPDGDLLFNSGEVWKLYRCGSENVFTFTSPLCTSDPYKTATFNDTFTRGEIVLAPELPAGIDPLMYPLDELLVSTLLGRGNGVELHGCGMIVDGRGHLFVGQSGAGKTTTARLWLEHGHPEILSDDRIVVRKLNGVLRMYGTPWHGEAKICSAKDVSLDALFLLTQSERSEIRPLDASAAVARLFSCSFPLFYDAESVASTLAFLGTIISQGIVHELAFRSDESAVRIVNDFSNWS